MFFLEQAFMYATEVCGCGYKCLSYVSNDTESDLDEDDSN